MCRDGGQPGSGGKTEIGETIFATGSFPPVRLHVPPSDAYTPRQPESKERLAEGLREVVLRMRQVEPVLDEIPPSNTVSHPRFGGLNAKEWFLLVGMHYRHHLLQKERLDAFLAV
ncbi:hypothetical protein [Paenibacillus sp. GYB003]|uniref:hypothetical protein n=1 Tax=Paenibacillus sp. GYB003 TaxID=2994392 RepID=UPI003FA7D794